MSNYLLVEGAGPSFVKALEHLVHAHADDLVLYSRALSAPGRERGEDTIPSTPIGLPSPRAAPVTPRGLVYSPRGVGFRPPERILTPRIVAQPSLSATQLSEVGKDSSLRVEPSDLPPTQASKWEAAALVDQLVAAEVDRTDSEDIGNGSKDEETVPETKHKRASLTGKSALLSVRELPSGSKKAPNTVVPLPCIRRFVHSTYFDLFVGFVVLLNVLVMILQLEKNGLEVGERMQLNGHYEIVSKTAIAFEVVEHCFNTIFVWELVCRLVVDGWRYFCYFSNFFDAFIVLASCIDAYLLRVLMNQKGGANLSFARMFRLLKLVKVLRAFRVAVLFSELRVLMKTLVSSMMALVWSAALLGLIIVAAGLLLAQLLASYIEDESGDFDKRVWTHRHYGTGSRSIYTVFEATLSGCWPNYARPLIDGVSRWFTLFWLFYVTIVVFAVIRVITALFLQKTMEAAKGDEEMMMLAKMKSKKAFVAKIEAFLTEADEDGDGSIDEDELQHFLSHPNFMRLLNGLGLEYHEVTAMFGVLDEGSGDVSRADFIAACLKLAGGPRAIDAVLVMNEQNKVKHKIDSICSHLGCQPKL